MAPIIDDLAFEREKTRREMANIIDDLEKATAADSQEERDHYDSSAALRISVIALSRPKYIDLVIARAKTRMEEEA